LLTLPPKPYCGFAKADLSDLTQMKLMSQDRFGVAALTTKDYHGN